jgi:hydroxymethylpyrimidine pyrophosphatase-like HAD family hydrolase
MSKRLVVIDMDGTLIFNSKVPFASINRSFFKAIQANDYDFFYIYTRPHLGSFLASLKDDDDNIIVLFSAGTKQYVDAVLTYVILPIAHIFNPSFTFDKVLSADDLSGGIIKDVLKLKSMDNNIEKSILIDDMPIFCNNCGADVCYLIPSYFPPSDPIASDTELLKVLGHDFFAKRHKKRNLNTKKS